MTPAQEAIIDRKIEKHFQSHRELANGRNFWAWGRNKDLNADQKYRKNFDNIFPNAPGKDL
jgi:hypothetical protein